ncbi:hypothetical protein KP509_29G069700 [Ceratopteris richardii]|uniref:Protein CHAPERONE-LIKE PROTEIN OF POR1, chloroplastic n=1 Tax=Ceratopteris richardii TaxID=49495 RepID=A0A8T2RA89_CERRI|nr:hypothetical protein KP509_29G069700 [Ceratopteris richardii]
MVTSLSSFPSPRWSFNGRGSHQLARTKFLGVRKFHFLLSEHMLSSNIRQAVFPTINERDPYKCLGIPRDASEEEIRATWSYLISLYDIVGESEVKEVAEYVKLPPWMQNLPNTYYVPSSNAILIRSAVFGALAIWSALDQTLGGPAFEMVLSLFCCIDFLNDRIKSKRKALLSGIICFILIWVLGSTIFLLIPARLYPKPWSTEVVTTLISYVLLWFS